jgi:hypothetical protein
MLLGTPPVNCDSTTPIDVMIAVGTMLAALASAFAAGSAICIASKARKGRIADRDRSEQREAQAQASRITTPSYSRLTRSNGRGHAEVQVRNLSDSPILDVWFELWLISDDVPKKQRMSLIRDTRAETIRLSFDIGDSTFALRKRRVRWRDHYGNLWVLDENADRPSPYKEPAAENAQKA